MSVAWKPLASLLSNLRCSTTIYGLVFLVFDVETVLLYPWAVAYNQVTLFGVLEVVLFILILAGGLWYAWRKGALEWA
jgi:NADH:ubiquinone oxidoreductase subunit 3 (subunit A)